MKMQREDLLRNREYWIIKIQSDLYEVVENYMKKNNLSRTDFAKKLKVTKGYITQVLKGDFNHKITKLIDLSLASGKAPILHFVDLEKYIHNDAEGRLDIYGQNFRPVNYVTNINIDSESIISSQIDFTNSSEKQTVSSLGGLFQAPNKEIKVSHN